MNQIYNFIVAHQVVITGAAVHFSHLAWSKLKEAWPVIKAALLYCRANGGPGGVIKEFLHGAGTTPAAVEGSKPNNPS